MPEFKAQAKEVVWHISNKYAKQMAEKSTVVSHLYINCRECIKTFLAHFPDTWIPLGVVLQNENKLDEMSKIMEVLHQYVPTHASEGQLTLPNGSQVPYDSTSFLEILLGGDQLTVA